MNEFSQIWIVSFGARWIYGEGWRPMFLAARELNTRQDIKLDGLALFGLPEPPYETEGTALIVGFTGEMIVGCHIRLGWPLPAHLVDLQVEFRNFTNGQARPCGDGLIGALIQFGLPVVSLTLSSKAIFDGLREITALERLYLEMNPGLDQKRAVLRGRYLVAAGRIEATGIPVDVSKLTSLKQHYRNLLRKIGSPIGDVRLSALEIGADGRNRSPLRPFASRTGRNQPSSNGYLMAAPGWLRRLIQPGPGRSLALIDWSGQEFGIAAALSGDSRMIADYQSGDPYLAPAERYGGDRTGWKACALGVLNGIGAGGLARKIGSDTSEARLLLQEHRAEYPAFWRWSEGAVVHALLHRSLQSSFGWRIAVDPSTSPRSLRNFPLQANGAEMLRLACCFATERGVMVCAPNHDALLIEAPLDQITDAIAVTRTAMAEASEIVLDGFQLRTKTTTIRHPDHYPHAKSDALWSEINRHLTDLNGKVEPVRERDAPCSQPNPRPISLYVFNRKDQSDDID